MNARNVSGALGVAALVVFADSVVAQTGRGTPLAQTIVAAVRSSTPPTPFRAIVEMTLTKDETAEFNAAGMSAVDAAKAISGESLSANEAFQVQIGFNAYRTRGLSTPLNRDLLARFEARVRLIDKGTFERWQQATIGLETNLGTRRSGPGEGTALVGAIAFQEGLFVGSGWKAGFPARALTRLESLPYQVVAALAIPSGIAPEFQRFIAYGLIQVDGLFAEDKFQQRVFDRELPAVTMLFAGK